jgi:hypothetical protein
MLQSLCVTGYVRRNSCRDDRDVRSGLGRRRVVLKTRRQFSDDKLL